MKLHRPSKQELLPMLLLCHLAASDSYLPSNDCLREFQHCQQDAQRDFKHVCGTDGRRYDNECSLLYYACSSGYGVRVSYHSLCNDVEVRGLQAQDDGKDTSEPLETNDSDSSSSEEEDGTGGGKEGDGGRGDGETGGTGNGGRSGIDGKETDNGKDKGGDDIDDSEDDSEDDDVDADDKIPPTTSPERSYCVRNPDDNPITCTNCLPPPPKLPNPRGIGKRCLSRQYRNCFSDQTKLIRPTLDIPIAPEVTLSIGERTTLALACIGIVVILTSLVVWFYRQLSVRPNMPRIQRGGRQTSSANIMDADESIATEEAIHSTAGSIQISSTNV